ncbi:hypothetical protein C343_03412 [Cryptococcus neoformans C23]|uniref:CxC1-like cysteine cluster associated with KDZ transposases domain-containing protein n=2 Tax=Cryptococcus neoformans TaxID=5207 RepID=A0A854QJP4_CRYNE|nr:hypothetical protein CNAG_02517 [Cryptococcus neoformans var. grubii H99]AUB25105.1 hypothetical protein CKF44_02517 [Cryptococcus neoformans var. grubii]OWZ31387.1 hypothetical protein C347_03475 [Cryptococcus neoformans var. grubii AD2-60a]OWZ42517.1 hypothetical protein C353_03318 [Cryptococcus neoformans var. grubii AD1-83a]OWZ43548.1 hypothetical protein C343_03412 [Cryptococcus neoformans var. grubii C23]OXC84465.1 hypothetical protein C344_03172 [Cryptococcus neoformans var. grubii A|eukprot:XP_012049686.1 hypothetical protein CNAG_02517 [Cryptococcus neoformans var. grubii H99]
MEVGEDSWTETVYQFIWEQTQKSKSKEAQSQYRTAMIVWTNEWKNIRTDMFDTYLRHKRLRDEGDIFLGIEHLNERCKCTSTKSRDVAFIDRDNHCYESVPFCNCIPDPVRLLARGFIAVSPDTPKTTISISLVQFFETIWESVPMSVSGFAEGLWRWHTLRGEPHISQITHRPRNGGPLLRQALFVFRDLLLQEAQFNREVLPLDPVEELSTKCPACFGPRVEGDLQAGDSNYILAVDGNFSHSRPSTAAKNDFAKIWPPSFLHKSYIEYAEHEENTTGGKGHKAVAEGDSFPQKINTFVSLLREW